jgi:putative phosphoesterase
MLIGVISDTHDNIDRIKQAIMIFNEKGVSLVVHAGDITSPFSLIPFEELKADFVGIFGNNDGDKVLLHNRSGGRIHPQPHIFEVDGKKIVLIHEHHIVEALASSGHYDIVIYGHTHKARVEKKNGTLIVNPGEAGHWLYGKATIALLDTEKMDAEIIPLP